MRLYVISLQFATLVCIRQSSGKTPDTEDIINETKPRQQIVQYLTHRQDDRDSWNS